MYFKIALGNVRRSIRDYSVYFLTLTFGVCLFYVFNSVQSQSVMLILSESQHQMMQLLDELMGIFSVFVCVVLGFLIVYANNFLIRRRKKELGLYLVLGMNKGNVARILVMETLTIGILAFLCGLVLGIVISQALIVVTANLFMVELRAFEFVLSGSAIGLSALFYGIIYLIVLVFNGFIISRYQLVDLFQGGRRNETIKLRSLGLSVVLFIVSLLTLGCAYSLILTNAFKAFDSQFAMSIVLGSIGTFLFFFSLSGFLLKFVQSRKKLYYRNLNMFVLRQLNSRINSAFVSMTVICILLLLTIGALCTGLSMNQVLANNTEQTAPYDATVTLPQTRTLDFELLQDWRTNQLAIDDIASQAAELDFYDLAVSYSDYCSEEFLAQDSLYLSEQRVDFIPLSQLNQVLSMQGRQPVSLAENEYLLTWSMNLAEQEVQQAARQNRILMIEGQEYRVVQPPIFVQLSNFSSYSNTITIALRDECFENKLPYSYTFNMNYKVPVEQGEQQLTAMLTQYFELTGGDVSSITRAEMYESSGGIKLIVSYIAIYLGLVFLMASAATLALQQLSQSADNVQRYALLRKIGVEEKMIRHSLLAQIAVYFLFPLALAIVHSIVGVKAVISTLQMFAKIQIGSQVVLVGLFLALIYGGYFLITYTGSVNMIRPRRSDIQRR